MRLFLLLVVWNTSYCLLKMSYKIQESAKKINNQLRVTKKWGCSEPREREKRRGKKQLLI